MIVQKPKKKKKLSRYTVLNIIMLIIFSAIIIRLVYLQVYKHEDYKERADVSSTRFIAENAPRGVIYDSEGNVLATNTQTYTLTYTETTEADENFYETMDKVFKILEENGEKFQDDLLLKFDENGKFYYDFKTSDPDSQKAVERLFKRDRGLNEDIEAKLFPDKEGDFTDEEISKVNEALFKLTPEETFYELVKIYDMYELILDENLVEDEKEKEIERYTDMSGEELTNLLLEKYSLQQIRNYMVIKDTIKMQSLKGYRSVTIVSNIKRDTALIVEQKSNDLPGIDVSSTPIRYYPYNNLGSAVLGYMSSIGSWEEEEYELLGYDVSSDLVGTAGIEAAFEEYLKGTKGGTTIKVNSKGEQTEKLFELESYPGNNVHLTIDKDIQYAAQKSLEDQINTLKSGGIARDTAYTKGATRGATVAIEVKTGRILALASYPDYDPNLFAIPGQLTTEQNKQYFNPDLEEFAEEHIKRTGATKGVDDIFPVDEDTGVRSDTNDIYPRSFFNYATLGLIPPGSSFKPITAVAGLEEGVFGTTETINDTGVYDIHSDELIGYAPENYGRIGNGVIDIRGALEKSSNFYFFETAYRLYHKNGANIAALDSLAEYAWKFGLGRDPNSQEKEGTGIEIAEYTGTMHTFQDFKDAKIKNSMFEVVEFLNKGVYEGYIFIPLDIGKSEDDTDELKKAKQDLKDKIIVELEKIGTDESLMGYDDFVNYIEPNVLEIMKYSPKYEETIEKQGGNVDKEYQAGIIASALAYYTINNKPGELTSPTEMLNAAIGQGMSTFTPLEIANAFATLANNGIRNRVRLVDKITTSDGKIVQEFQTEQVDKIDIKEENYEAIKDGMWRVNNVGSGFTQDTFSGFPIKTGGKTGTADFANSDERYKEIGRQPYATYGGFAPLDDPEIAVFTVIYDGYRGSYASLPARAVYEAYFSDRLLEMDPDWAQKSEYYKKYVADAPKDNKKTEETDKEEGKPAETKPEDPKQEETKTEN